MKISSKELLSLPTSHLHVTRLLNSRNNNNHNKFIMRKNAVRGGKLINEFLTFLPVQQQHNCALVLLLIELTYSYILLMKLFIVLEKLK